MTKVQEFERDQQVPHNLLKETARPEEMLLQEELHGSRLSI
jgi:hypothetical protein